MNYIPVYVSILTALKAISMKWPKECWVPSAIRIFRENGCRFERDEGGLFCRNGLNRIGIDEGLVETYMETDDYKGLTVYFGELCESVRDLPECMSPVDGKFC